MNASEKDTGKRRLVHAAQRTTAFRAMQSECCQLVELTLFRRSRMIGGTVPFTPVIVPMSLEFLNPALLWGLAATAIPVVAHLLTKRRYDVVDWGAMQFLDLGKQRRRRVRLEEMLLLLLRMLLIGLLAFALARPTISGTWWGDTISMNNRDVVFVIDGSYSMERRSGELTLHDQAKALIRRLLKRSQTGDTFAILDVRDKPQPVIGRPTRDVQAVTESIDELPGPAGSSDFAQGVAQALEILGTTSHARRDIIVLTDGQAHGWQLDDKPQWSAVDELRSFPAVEPQIWVVNLRPATSTESANYSLGPLSLSRESVPVGFPVQITTTLTYSGEVAGKGRIIQLEVDGQTLAESAVQSPTLDPGGQFIVDFDYTFTTPGSHVISVVMPPDDVPGDDRVEASITVTDSPRVVLVDGDPHLDSTRGELFFAQAALQGDSDQAPLVDIHVISPGQLKPGAVAEADVVVLANVDRFSQDQANTLTEFVDAGGGLLIAPGRNVESGNYQQMLGQLLPAQLVEFQSAESGAAGIDVNRLQFPWPVEDADRADFAAVQFHGYWRLEPDSAATVFARFSDAAPLLVSGDHGRGKALLLGVPLDADAGNLPTKSAYVTLLYEMLFYLAEEAQNRRNHSVGDPLVWEIPDAAALDQYSLQGPGGVSADLPVSGRRPAVRFEETALPGVYSIQRTHTTRGGTSAVETKHFVVDFDRDEADLTPLTAEERQQLSVDHGISFAVSADAFENEWRTAVSRTELWPLLLLIVLGLLNLEIWLTRRLVRGGHAVLDNTQPSKV